LGGPIVAVTQQGSIDYWTGEIAPMIPDPRRREAGGVQTEFAIPHDYWRRRVIPLPVAFAAGSLLTLAVIIIAARRPRGPAPNPAVPAA